MQQRLLASLLVLGVCITVMQGLPSQRPFGSVLASQRDGMADPDSWALVRGPRTGRAPERLTGASTSPPGGRLPTPDSPAILADGARVPGLGAIAWLSTSLGPAGDPASYHHSISRAPPRLAVSLPD